MSNNEGAQRLHCLVGKNSFHEFLIKEFLAAREKEAFGQDNRMYRIVLFNRIILLILLILSNFQTFDKSQFVNP